MKSNNISLVLLMVASAVGFSIIQGLIRFLGVSVFSWTKAFYRSLFGLAFLLIWTIFSGKKITFHNIPILFIRGFFGGLSLAFSFLSIDILDLSRATFYLYTFPIFAPIFAVIFFKEKFYFLYFIPLVLSALGIYFISSVNNFNFTWKDIIGLSSGISAGIAISTLKELRKTNNAESIYFCFTFMSIIVTSIGVLFFNESFYVFKKINIFTNVYIWCILIVIGLIATMSQIIMTYSYKRFSTVFASILSLLTMPLSVLYSVFIFKEKVGVISIFGGILIFISAVSAVLIEKNSIRGEI